MEKLLQMALKKARQAEVYWIEEENLPVQISQKQVSHINGSKKRGISLRIIDENGRMGMATSTHLNREDLVERALLSAKYSDKTDLVFPTQEGSDVKCFDPVLAEMTDRKMVQQAWQMLQTLDEIDKEIDVELGLNRTLQRIRTMNSSGLNISYDRTNFGIGITSIADNGFREYHDWDLYSRHFTFDRHRLENFVRFHHLAKENFKVKTGKMDIVFNPGACWPLLLRLFDGVDGSNILRQISPLNDRLGEEIFSPLINVVDDPTDPWGFNSRPYDDEGSIAKRTPIIEQGVLKNYLFDLNSATQYGIESTGNGFKQSLFEKGIDLLPQPYVSNFNLLPGKSTFTEMVQDMERGIIVNQIMGGHTGNRLAGEFGLNIGSGYLVEKGQIKGKVMDAMVSGNIYDLFKRVTKVGQQRKATRAVFYGFGYAPPILVPELTVAGE